MFQVGEIVRIFAPIAGKNKYHLCIAIGSDDVPSQFIFLNSNPNYAGSFSVPCARVPCIDPSETGVTAFSFSMLPRYSNAQLKTYRAAKVGDLDPNLAEEILKFVQSDLKTLTRTELSIVVVGLTAIAASGGSKATADT